MRYGTYCEDVQGCRGHLGKFDDCRDEALYEITMDGGDDSTGDVEFEGHFTLLTFAEPETVRVRPYDDDDMTSVEIEAGAYLVQAHNSGMVSVQRYETEELARADFDLYDRAYGDWMGDDDDL